MAREQIDGSILIGEGYTISLFSVLAPLGDIVSDQGLSMIPEQQPKFSWQTLGYVSAPEISKPALMSQHFNVYENKLSLLIPPVNIVTPRDGKNVISRIDESNPEQLTLHYEKYLSTATQRTSLLIVDKCLVNCEQKQGKRIVQGTILNTDPNGNSIDPSFTERTPDMLEIITFVGCHLKTPHHNNVLGINIFN